MSNSNQNSKSPRSRIKRSQPPLIPIEWSDPATWRAPRLPLTYVLEYPFGFVVSDPNIAGKRGERSFSSLEAARAFLGLQANELTLVTRRPTPRYGIVVSKADRILDRSVRLHSYIAACSIIERQQVAHRLAHVLELDVDFFIEDRLTGTTSTPEFVSDLGVLKDLVYTAPKTERGPEYTVVIPSGVVAIWTGASSREELWQNPELMRLFYALPAGPATSQAESRLPEYAIARVDNDELVPVASGYHSMLHAARTSVWLKRESGRPCVVWDGSEPHFFDDLVFRGDVVRIDPDGIECLQANMVWNQVVLTRIENVRCSPVVLKAR